MALTDYNVVDALGLVQDFWAPLFEKELRESSLWLGILQDPRYTLEKVRGGDTYKISYINKPSSTIRTIGTDADTYETNTLSTTQVDLKITKRATSAYKIEDLADLMSQLESADSEIRMALLADVRKQVNDYIKSLISPSSASPDHVLSGVSDFNLSQLSIVRTAAAVAKWGSSGEPWYLLADPTYFSDMVDDTTLASAEAMGIGTSPIIEGRFAVKRMGFNILEDDSLDTDNAFAFIPSFMRVIAGQPRFKLSDLHVKGEFGYNLSVDMVVGAKQLSDTRVIRTYNS
jgi:hypothetical protein